VDAPALLTPFFDYGFGFDNSILLLLKQKIPNATLEKQWLNVAVSYRLLLQSRIRYFLFQLTGYRLT
jgi:hypothetical protein